MDTEFHSEDVVNLIVLFEANYMYLTMSRELAMNEIKRFFEVREGVRGKNKECANSYFGGTIVGCGISNGRQWPDHWALAYDKVIGMYIMETNQSSQEKLASAQARIDTILESHVNEGEDWKGENNDSSK